MSPFQRLAVEIDVAANTTGRAIVGRRTDFVGRVLALLSLWPKCSLLQHILENVGWRQTLPVKPHFTRGAPPGVAASGLEFPSGYGPHGGKEDLPAFILAQASHQRGQVLTTAVALRSICPSV
jgi:hypothetical protein